MEQKSTLSKILGALIPPIIGARAVFLTLVIIFSSLTSFAQLTPQGSERMKLYEDSLKFLSTKVLSAERDSAKIRACYKIIPTLVEALKTPGSFKYKFESLESISILYPDDSTFRIFSWTLPRGDGSYRYFGAIQKNNLNKLDLIPMFDRSDSIDHPEDTILKPVTWYGVVYYHLQQVKAKGKTYYMLFGLDGYDLMSTRKILDVLYFENDGIAKFGAPIFEMEKGSTYHPKRLVLEYKKDANITLNYSEEKKMIVFDHLVAQSEKTADLHFTFQPDGSYDGLKWNEKEGKWILVDNIFSDVIDSRKGAPVPQPKGSHDMKGKKQ